MKECSTFIDMRIFKNWAHKISSWKYLIIEDLSCQVFPWAQSASFLLSTLNSLRGCWRSAAAAVFSTLKAWTMLSISVYLSIIYLPTYLPVYLSVLPGWLSGKESACQCRVNPWVSKIPRRRKWQPTPVFLPRKIPWTEESGGLQSMGSRKSWTWPSD